MPPVMCSGMNRSRTNRARLAPQGAAMTGIPPLRSDARSLGKNGRHRRKLAQIVAFCRLLARVFRPRKIILFGSYAYGRPTRESDVDLLVIMPHRSGPVRQSVAIRQRCAAPFPLDLLVWTPGYARKRQSWDDSFTREVFGQGKIMYETGHS